MLSGVRCGIVEGLSSNAVGTADPTRQVSNTVSEATNEMPWGRVDEDRTVYVRDGEGERAVGSFPDGTPEEALAYFERKFADLAGAVTLLEARIARGTADASVAGTVTKLQEQLVEPAAVGNIDALRGRVAKLAEKAAAFGEQQQQEREAAREEAVAKREAIVAEAEQLAAQPEASIRWKDTSTAFERLFNDWQNAQRSGPHVPKPQADAMWKRFRAARQSFDTARRAHFSQMDANNKDVKSRKERLIASAEALADRGLDGIPAYRNLLDEWKQAGRASRKLDDQLWARFKAAGDVLYQAKAEEVAQTNEEYQENLVAKQAILEDAEADPRDHRPRSGPQAAHRDPAPLGRDRPRTARVPPRHRGRAAARRGSREGPRGRALAQVEPRDQGPQRGPARPARGVDRRAWRRGRDCRSEGREVQGCRRREARHAAVVARRSRSSSSQQLDSAGQPPAFSSYPAHRCPRLAFQGGGSDAVCR